MPIKVDRSLVRAVVMSRVWVKRLEVGEPHSIRGLARAEGICILHTAKFLPLAFLAPDLVAQILEGRQPRTLTLTALISEPRPFDWAANARGLPPSPDAGGSEELTFSIRREKRALKAERSALSRQHFAVSDHLLSRITPRTPPLAASATSTGMRT